MTTQRTATGNPAHVDVEPFRRIINRWLDQKTPSWTTQNDAHPDGNANPHPSTTLCELLWPDLDPVSADRMLYRLLHEQSRIHFDMADLIVCRLLGDPQLWRCDPELNAIYEQVNLFSVDVQAPTCEAAREHAEDRVRSTFAATRSRSQTSRELGLSWHRVNTILEGATREAVAA